MIKKTKNLILRTFTTNDVTQGYIDALNDYSVVKFTEARHKKWDRESVNEFINESNIEGKTHLIGIFLRESNKHIGNIRLLNMSSKHKRVELGIMLFDKKEWSKGYGTEAIRGVSQYIFEEQNLHKICADYYSLNQASARMFYKAGFEVEGIYKDHFLFENTYIDSIRVGLLNKRLFESNKKPNMPSAGPSITFKEVQLATEAAANGWYSNMSMHLEEFIKEFKKFSGKKYILPTSSCTVAIHLALLALNIGPGDEVIVPDISWVASAAPIHYTGGTIVFADVDQETWCLNAESFEARITDKTKAVIIVDLYGGMPSDIDKIQKIAKQYNIKTIEDAAEGIGAEYKGKKAGVFGDISVYSFNGTKLIVGGQGGVIATDNKEYFDKIKLLHHHGIDRNREGKYFWSYEIGYNYQWTNIQAAITLAQLRRINEMVEKRRQRGMWYKERFSEFDGIYFNYDEPPVKNTFWTVTTVYDEKYKIEKEKILEYFQKNNVDLRPFFYPISSMPAYAQYTKGKDMKKLNPISYKISPFGVSLPSAMSITEKDVDFVSKKLIDLLLKHKY